MSEVKIYVFKCSVCDLIIVSAYYKQALYNVTQHLQKHGINISKEDFDKLVKVITASIE